MEEVSARRPSRRRAVLIAAGLGAVAVALVVAWQALYHLPPARLVAAGTPLLQLKVDVEDEARGIVPADQTRISGDPTASQQPTRSNETLAAQEISVRVKRAPIAASLYVLDGSSLLNWLEANGTARQVIESDVVQGIFQDLMRTLHVRGQDVKLPQLQGYFLLEAAREIVAAGVALHFDRSRGRRGYVLSFERRRARFASRILPIALSALARRQYRLPKLDTTIIEAMVGEQTIFVSEVDGIVYVAGSLAALLNVLEAGPLPPPRQAAGTLAVHLRAEAWLRDLLPALMGRKQWAATWSIDLSRGSAGVIETDGGKLLAELRPALAEGVLAAIPRDVFAAAALSTALPDWTLTEADGDAPPRDGRNVAAAKAAGVGVVWDLSASDAALSQVGLIAANAAYDKSRLRQFVSDKAFAAPCAGDTIWIAATSEALLTRMREACERDSLNMLDRQRGGNALPQMFLSLNPAVALSELLNSGIGARKKERGEEQGAAPEWKQLYDQAVERSRLKAELTAAKLPALIYEGTATANGAKLSGSFDAQPAHPAKGL